MDHGNVFKATDDRNEMYNVLKARDDINIGRGDRQGATQKNLINRI